MKEKTIVLKFMRIPLTWEVMSIRNSLELDPGTWINRDYVTKLVNDPGWDVTIVESSLLPPLPMPIPLPVLERSPDVAN